MERFQLDLNNNLIVINGIDGNQQHIINDSAEQAFFGWTTMHYPIRVLFDFKTVAKIDKLVFSSMQARTVIVRYFTNNPFVAPVKEEVVKVPYNNKAFELPVALHVRFIEVEQATKATFPKIQVWGDKSTFPNALPVAKPFVAPAKVGFTSFYWMPLETTNITKAHRWYHDWENHGKEPYPGKYNFIVKIGSKQHLVENLIREHLDKKINPVIVLQKTPAWILDRQTWNPDREQEFKPIYPDANGNKPDSYKEESYIAFADLGFQFAARVGHTVVDPSRLKVADGQPVLSGAGLTRVVKCWNEPGKTWKSREGMFFPLEYAAMLSAFYDGHRGALGNNVGVKNADPTMIVSTAGFHSASIEYLKVILLYCEFMRGGQLCFDAIAVHYYVNDGDNQATTRTTGILPEISRLGVSMQALSDFRDRYLPGKPLNLGEIGYDTFPTSVQRAPVVGAYTMEQSQALSIVRCCVDALEHGVNTVNVYNIRDETTQKTLNEGKTPYTYGTSGLVKREVTNFVTTYDKKFSHPVFERFAFLFDMPPGGLFFTYAITIGNYKARYFKSSDNSMIAVFVNRADSTDAREEVIVPVHPDSKNLRLLSLETGAEAALNTNQGAVRVPNVGAFPVVIIGNGYQEPTTPPVPPVPGASVQVSVTAQGDIGKISNVTIQKT